MKKTALILALAMALPASAQTEKTPAKPAAQEVAKPAAHKRVAKKNRRSEDARHCLEKASNTEIIKCAEVYL